MALKFKSKDKIPADQLTAQEILERIQKAQG